MDLIREILFLFKNKRHDSWLIAQYELGGKRLQFSNLGWFNRFVYRLEMER